MDAATQGVEGRSQEAKRASTMLGFRKLPRELLVVLCLSLGLKAAIWYTIAGSDPSRFFSRDSHSYHRSASALVELGHFAVASERPETPQTTRTPIYPAFLAAVYSIFGTHPAAAVAAQILLSLATIIQVWLIARQRWGERTALLAAGLLAADSASFSHSLLLLTETLFTFLICSLLYIAIRYNGGWRRSALLGLVLALATLARPVTYYLVLPLAVWVGIASRRRNRSWIRVTIAVAGLLLPYLLLIGGWHARNWHLTGTAIFSRIEGVNMLFFRGAAIVAARDGIGITEARERLGKDRYQEIYPETHGWSDERLAVRWKHEGLQLIRDHPWIFARQQLDGLAATFLGTGEHTIMRLMAIPLPETGPLGDLLRLAPRSYVERWPLGRPFSFLVFLASLAYLGILYSASAGWLLSSHREGASRFWDACCWGVFLYLAVFSAGPEAYHRFRVPLTPILCLYGAAGLMALRASWGVHRS